VPIKPNLSGPSDVSYFDYIPDSQRVKQSIHKSEDPFKEWWILNDNHNHIYYLYFTYLLLQDTNNHLFIFY